jgi:hypothetical protein
MAGRTLTDLFDTALLTTMIQEGYVRVQRHPTDPGQPGDGRDRRPRLWQDIRPAADWTPSGRVLSEDVA